MQGAQGFGLLRGAEGRAVPGDNGGLFRRNLPQTVAEVLHVVQADGGEDGHVLGHGVGGIEPAAHACFQNDELHLLLGKVHEGERQHQLKEGGLGSLP